MPGHGKRPVPMNKKKINERPERTANIGFVVIGRNEGERLRHCIESIREQSLALERVAEADKFSSNNREKNKTFYPIVYVDSGSSDGSVAFAKSSGCYTVQLDSTTMPFTAARARNAGLEHLLENFPAIQWVQFVDGDCSLQPGWLPKAITYLSVNPRVAIVCGRRREVYPQKTIYNALCDMEWDTPVGEAQSCGGDFLARRVALESVKAFNPEMIAGEEPEMCFRLRKEKWRIWRLGEEMTSHDAAMTRFHQFWLRNKRAGYAYAERCFMHATKKRPYCVREVISICLWALFIPGLIIMFVPVLPAISILLFLSYPSMIVRVFIRRLKLRNTIRRSVVYSVLTMVGKFPQFIGVAKFAVGKIAKSGSTIIEYK